MWQGRWLPCVHQFSSNWKELNTLRITLETLKGEPAAAIRGTTLFYFTDNSTTYWIMSNGSSKNLKLHLALEEIRALEVQLGCCLNVIHVPGLLMIQEGTDGLSRGIWITPWHSPLARRDFLSGIFAPFPVNPDVIDQYTRERIPALHQQELQECPLPIGHPRWELHPWDTPPHLLRIRGRFTIWHPPPEMARQVITWVMEAYVEDPLSTSALLFIPRILPACWRGLSKCLRELPALYPHKAQLTQPPLLPIPVTVLYLPRHHRVCKPKGLDPSAPTKGARWHQAQAQQMRGMLEISGGDASAVEMPVPDHWVPAEWY
jgi:hypothetical protein